MRGQKWFPRYQGEIVLRYRSEQELPSLNSVEAGELRGQPLRRALSFVTMSWVFGAVWATAIGGAPFSLFARDLGASELQIGVLAALPFLASLFSMPASAITERTGARKSIFLWATCAQRLLWFPIAAIPLRMTRRRFVHEKDRIGPCGHGPGGRWRAHGCRRAG